MTAPSKALALLLLAGLLVVLVALVRGWLSARKWRRLLRRVPDGAFLHRIIPGCAACGGKPDGHRGASVAWAPAPEPGNPSRSLGIEASLRRGDVPAPDPSARLWDDRIEYVLVSCPSTGLVSVLKRAYWSASMTDEWLGAPVVLGPDESARALARVPRERWLALTPWPKEVPTSAP